jgi:hypothetical protein
MRKRAMLLGLIGLGLIGLAGPANAQDPDGDRERLERARALRRQLVALEGVGRARVMKERGLKQPSRQAVNSYYNVERFEPVTARFVRFTVSATVNGSEPCLHTLDLSSPDSPANLMTTAGVRLTASSLLPAFRHHFSDGKYTPPGWWCWISAERGAGWLQVELPKPATISRLVWSRDARNQNHDRVPTAYKVEVSEDGRVWKTVATGEDRLQKGADYQVSREASVQALDADQQMQHQALLAMLRKLGGSLPYEVKSGPQVGENVNGAFSALFLNGIQQHVGKQCCPV